MNALSFESLADHADSLREAICVSLFTHEAIYDGAQEAIQESGTPTPWWANALSQTSFGSKLWSLHREKVTSETLELAALYAKEALMFLVHEGDAPEIDVKAQPIPKGIELQILVLLKTNLIFR